MNHLVRNNNSPDEENKTEYIECPDCLSTGEVFISEDGIEGTMEQCVLCLGEGKIERTDGYNSRLDYLDDRADEAHDEDVFFKDDER